MLLVGVGVEFDHIGNFSIRESLDALSSLSVPELDRAIIRCREELFTSSIESDVLDGLRVAHEGTQAVALVIHIPELLSVYNLLIDPP